MEKQIFVNGKPVSEEELSKMQEEFSKTKGMKLVEITPNNYRVKMFG